MDALAILDLHIIMEEVLIIVREALTLEVTIQVITIIRTLADLHTLDLHIITVATLIIITILITIALEVHTHVLLMELILLIALVIIIHLIITTITTVLEVLIREVATLLHLLHLHILVEEAVIVEVLEALQEEVVHVAVTADNI